MVDDVLKFKSWPIDIHLAGIDFSNNGTHRVACKLKSRVYTSSGMQIQV